MTTRYRSRKWPLVTSCPLLLFSTPGMAAADPQHQDLLVLTMAVVAILLILTIALLQRSRLRHKRMKKALAASRNELEQRVVERTEKLRNINNKLYTEISRHEATEKLLRETQDYLHSMINSMPSIIIGINRRGAITHWNSAAEQATSITPAKAMGKPLTSVYPLLPIEQQDIARAISAEQLLTKENLLHQDKLGKRHIDITVYPLISASTQGAVIRIDDISLRVEMESRMIQNEKMLSLGELAAGLAHEINNPLGAIAQNSQNILRRLSSELDSNHQIAATLGIDLSQIRDYLEQRQVFHFADNIKEASQRAATIVENMLGFARYDKGQQVPTDLRNLINTTLSLAKSYFRTGHTSAPDIAIQCELPEGDFPAVICSGMEIQQVLLNLLHNAAQALDDQTDQRQSPRITIALSNNDHEAVISIQDNGPGIEPEARPHIFEPFYTTKDVGQGTGLGLSVSYFIITRHHGGSIEAQSEPGLGTCFTITLPLAR